MLACLLFISATGVKKQVDLIKQTGRIWCFQTDQMCKARLEVSWQDAHACFGADGLCYPAPASLASAPSACSDFHIDGRYLDGPGHQRQAKHFPHIVAQARRNHTPCGTSFIPGQTTSHRLGYNGMRQDLWPWSAGGMERR